MQSERGFYKTIQGSDLFKGICPFKFQEAYEEIVMGTCREDKEDFFRPSKGIEYYLVRRDESELEKLEPESRLRWHLAAFLIDPDHWAKPLRELVEQDRKWLDLMLEDLNVICESNERLSLSKSESKRDPLTVNHPGCDLPKSALRDLAHMALPVLRSITEPKAIHKHLIDSLPDDEKKNFASQQPELKEEDIPELHKST